MHPLSVLCNAVVVLLGLSLSFCFLCTSCLHSMPHSRLELLQKVDPAGNPTKSAHPGTCAGSRLAMALPRVVELLQHLTPCSVGRVTCLLSDGSIRHLLCTAIAAPSLRWLISIHPSSFIDRAACGCVQRASRPMTSSPGIALQSRSASASC